MNNQVLIQKQSQRLTPQQVQVVRLLELPVDELEQRIHEELENNFALEEADPANMATTDSADADDGADAADDMGDGDEAQGAESDTDGPADGLSPADEEPFFDYDDDSSPDTSSNNATAEDNGFVPFSNVRTDTSFREDLVSQLSLRNITTEQRFLAQYIIDSLDDSGYLTRPISALVDDLAFTQNHDTTEEAMLEALEIVQDLDPAGIGARDLRECLLLQLEVKTGTATAQLAYNLLHDAFDDFSNKRYERLLQRFNISREQLEAAQKVILTLHPKPGGVAADLNTEETKASHTTPDFIVESDDGQLTISLNDNHVPSVKISAEYNKMLDTLKADRVHKNKNKDSITLIKEKITSGNLFVDALRQRRQTLMAVMQAIVQMQRDYFLSGDPEQLRPMVLREVSERSGYDISTISRVSNSKFVQTDFGVFPVKQLFTEGMQKDDGNSVSNVAIRQFLQHCIEEEDKKNPLTDERLTELLKAEGYPVARRTVAKYREQLGYNTARLRREV